KAPYDYAPI
nr:Chain P, Dopamine beta-hydroxylase [Mus musculus]6G9R_I Chain I, Dopamine beta-hydroxylase [Mus musculus]6G9R_J Chain J, Dopamine beta-hydroxylase [Mus musculus]6G9R_K Chain K, Dopamine beta-hydroxylase [Mus musculus]6G9R_P Chain P, Dopamine beta-hydroxylase [Mus musculus]